MRESNRERERESFLFKAMSRHPHNRFTTKNPNINIINTLSVLERFPFRMKLKVKRIFLAVR